MSTPNTFSTHTPPHPGLRRRHALLAALGSMAALPVRAQDSNPARILVGFPAGGAFDAVARLLANELKTVLKRPVLVDNRPGAGGRLAVDLLRGAKPDGSVLMLGPDALTALYPFTYSKLNYDPAKDLVPVGTVSEFPFVLVAGSEPPVKTLTQYIAWARANPERAQYGVPARGAPHHFFGMALGKTIGVKLEDVPYQGSAPLMLGLMGGQVSCGIDVLGSVLEQYKAGKVSLLAVSSPQRMPQVPEVPTFAELGYPGISGMGFNGLYAPAGTPATVVGSWNQALAQVMAQAAVRERLMVLGALPVGKSADELNQRGHEAAKRWGPVIKASGFTAD
ncbi:MAG: Bug family tripartite tricarboxylate transporter substrate binding protein [Curvibacter lanceolatus]|uniref:Bug family tripartite tricarboxylate transporter substrate binding protein n=1 Tax=Curvibacter lanceolatus TaxID=86182 RepID=UPI0003A2027F|nr:Bug family tripartite tricarboxylate transporter substrate binding protein [Curvibacter lanceolatus]MBV5294635.1 Bug family tripartite tricarboxylate transporter substrate binding protein [Curvibacter lanceolatus]